MKKTFKQFGLAVVIAAIALNVLLIGCGDGDDGGGSKDPDLSGTITINPSGTAVVNTELTATYDGTETVSYQWKNDSTNVGTDSNKFTPTATGSYTVTVSATGYNSKTSAAVNVVTWENMPVADRWGKDVWEDTTATVDYSVDADGVCTIIVGGTPPWTNPWENCFVAATYAYTAKAGVSYVYKFEAWTESGTREFTFQYCSDNDEKVYIGRGIPITSIRKTYTIRGQALSNSAFNRVDFQCASQTGTFYIKVLEITEVVTPTFTSIADMAEWLSQPDTYDHADYTVKLNVSDLGGSADTPGSAGYVLCDSDKLVNLDLSGSTFTSIGEEAFAYCYNLTNVKIPNSVTRIGEAAFYDCFSAAPYTGLTITIPNRVTSIGEGAFYSYSINRVKFEGTIASGNIYVNSFAGDLRDKYLAGGIGMYIRDGWGESSTWTKE